MDYREILDESEQVYLFNEFLDEVRKDTSKVYGSRQILERIEEIAIEKHLIDCPYCRRKRDYGHKK